MVWWCVLVQQQSKHHRMLWLSDGWHRRNVLRETPLCYDWATLVWLNLLTCALYPAAHRQVRQVSRADETKSVSARSTHRANPTTKKQLMNSDKQTTCISQHVISLLRRLLYTVSQRMFESMLVQFAARRVQRVLRAARARPCHIDPSSNIWNQVIY